MIYSLSLLQSMVRIAALVTIASLAACAPSLDERMRVEVIPEASVDTSRPWRSPAKIRIERFNDARADSAIAEVNGRKVQPDGDVGGTIQQAFDRALRAKGATVTLFDAPLTISGDVTSWRLQVQPGFPTTKLEATAVLKVYLTESSGQIVYRGSYTGASSFEHPYPQKTQIESVLGQAMAEAIDAAVKDSGLADAIRSRPHRTDAEPRKVSSNSLIERAVPAQVTAPLPPPTSMRDSTPDLTSDEPPVERVTQPSLVERDRY